MNAPLQKSRLGRGLASLIGEPMPGGRPQLPPEGEQRMVPIGGHSPEPAQSAQGIPRGRAGRADRIDPLQGPGAADHRAPGGERGYEIVAGERRWRAAQKAGLHTVPVIVRDLTDQEVLELAIIENVQRADLNAIEEAAGLSRADRALRLQPGAALRDHRQEPQPRRQHAAPAEAARRRADHGAGRAGSRPVTRARSSVARTPRRLPSVSSPTASTCARSRRWCRAGEVAGGGSDCAHAARQGSRHQGLREGACRHPRPEGRDQARLGRERQR